MIGLYVITILMSLYVLKQGKKGVSLGFVIVYILSIAASIMSAAYWMMKFVNGG